MVDLLASLMLVIGSMGMVVVSAILIWCWVNRKRLRKLFS
jgi:hypothetical protein